MEDLSKELGIGAKEFQSLNIQLEYKIIFLKL